MENRSHVVGLLLQLLGVVGAIVSMVTIESNAKIGLLCMGIVITFLGRLIKEYEWLFPLYSMLLQFILVEQLAICSTKNKKGFQFLR
jgi:hypothetical protein